MSQIWIYKSAFLPKWLQRTTPNWNTIWKRWYESRWYRGNFFFFFQNGNFLFLSRILSIVRHVRCCIRKTLFSAPFAYFYLLSNWLHLFYASSNSSKLAGKLKCDGRPAPHINMRSEIQSCTQRKIPRKWEWQKQHCRKQLKLSRFCTIIYSISFTSFSFHS